MYGGERMSTEQLTLADLDERLARLAIWRHMSPAAEAAFDAALEQRHAMQKELST